MRGPDDLADGQIGNKNLNAGDYLIDDRKKRCGSVSRGVNSFWD
jgi:hypothetical protein